MAAPDERGRARPESGADGMCRARPERGGDGGRPPPLPGRVVPRRVVAAPSGLFRVPERRVRGGGADAAPGGRIHVLFSNRLFIEKAVGIWTGADDVDHAYTVGACLHYCGGGLEDVRVQDLSARSKKGNGPIVGDPLYAVSATKR